MRRDVNLTNWSANWGQLSCARQPLPVHACVHHTADGCRALALCTCSQAATALAHIRHGLAHILRAHNPQYIASSDRKRVHTSLTHSHAFHLRSCFSCARIGTHIYIRAHTMQNACNTSVHAHCALVLSQAATALNTCLHTSWVLAMADALRRWVALAVDLEARLTEVEAASLSSPSEGSERAKASRVTRSPRMRTGCTCSPCPHSLPSSLARFLPSCPFTFLFSPHLFTLPSHPSSRLPFAPFSRPLSYPHFLPFP